MKVFSIASTLLSAITLTGAPAIATPQPQEGRVAVGPIGSATRSWVSATEAQRLCRERGCWVTDGVEVTPGNWVPNTLFPGAMAFQEPGTGHGLLEVRPSR